MRSLLFLLCLLLACEVMAVDSTICRVRVPVGNGIIDEGTGCVVRPGIVLTNSHVVSHRTDVSPECLFEEVRLPGKLLKIDKTWDLAAIAVDPTKVKPVVWGARPQTKQILTVCGFGGRPRRRSLVGRVREWASPVRSSRYEFFVVDAESRNGDSGGPILNQDGEYVGIIWGGRSERYGLSTHGTSITVIREFLEGL